MKVFWTVVIVVLVLLVIAAVVLYFVGNKMQARQAEQQAIMDQMAQTISMLIIDKKRLKLKDAAEAGLPKAAVEQAPWYAKRMKVPIVKAKIQNRIMVLMADDAVYEVLPTMAEVKVVVSGIYITAIKSVRGASIKAPEKKKGFMAKVRGIFKK